jgi:hypothetical protein
MRKSLRIRKIYTVSDEPLLPKVHIFHSTGYYAFSNSDWYEMQCGKIDTHDELEWEYHPSMSSCYDCLDTVVKLGKECADRLAELPPRVS